MLQIENLTKKFGKNTVLEHISLSLEKSNYGLLGPNGAGKTTLFRVITGLLHADSGTIHSDLDRQIRIGYLPQKFGAFPNLTVEEQLKYFARLKATKNDGVCWKDEISHAISIAHLEKQRFLRCGKLSGGMTRRLGLAQAIMGCPDLILLDEPTVGLDIGERLHFMEILDQIQGKQSLIFSTHILNDVQDSCKEVIILNEGTIAFQGDFPALKSVAEGKVWEMPEKEFSLHGEQFQFIAHLEKNGERYVRAYLKTEQVPEIPDAFSVQASVEDAYLILLNGDDPYDASV